MKTLISNNFYLSKIFGTFFLVFTMYSLNAQQYLNDKLVGLTIKSDTVQSYFSMYNTVFILENVHCNPENFNVLKLGAQERVIFVDPIAIENRNLKRWIEFLGIRRNDNTAKIRFKLKKGGTHVQEFEKNGLKWKKTVPK